MRKKKSELRVFKLRSGEEIIAKVAGKTKSKTKLSRPMCVIKNYQTDPYTGVKRQIVFFSDWLGSTSDLMIEIPTNFIIAELLPDPDLINLYAIQSENDDNHKTPTGSRSQPAHPQITDEDIQKMKNEADKLVNGIMKRLSDEGAKKENPQNPSTPGIVPPSTLPPMSPIPFMQMPSFPPVGRGKNEIMISVNIPNDVMMHWFEIGVLDYLADVFGNFMGTDFFREMMSGEDDSKEPPKKRKKKKSNQEKISNKDWIEPSDDRKKEMDYGMNPDDWSPYLKDYISPPPPKPNDDPPKKEE